MGGVDRKNFPGRYYQRRKRTRKTGGNEKGDTYGRKKSALSSPDHFKYIRLEDCCKRFINPPDFGRYADPREMIYEERQMCTVSAEIMQGWNGN